MSLQIIIVAPYSPKWSNIASVRWEHFSKFLSEKYDTFYVTSSFQDEFVPRKHDIGNAKLIEIPIVFCLRNPYTQKVRLDNSELMLKRQNGYLNLFYGRIKAESRILLEKMFPFSAGGILYHNFSEYLFQIERLIRENENTVLITSYDPWFSLKIGHKIKKKFAEKVIWFADFRDPSYNLHESIISKLKIFSKMTKNILNNVDGIFVVTKSMEREYRTLTKNLKRVYFLPNGYYSSSYLDCIALSKEKSQLNSKTTFRIVYTGSLHTKTREIKPFVQVLKRIYETAGGGIVFEYAGFQSLVIQKIFEEAGLDKILKNHGLLPREKALELQQSADLLLLIAYTGNNEREGNHIRTGKIYEYLGTCKPILAIAPKGWEMREELECDGVSKVFEKSEITQMTDYILNLCHSSDLEINLENRRKVAEQYNYKNLSIKLEEIILNTISEKRLWG